MAEYILKSEYAVLIVTPIPIAYNHALSTVNFKWIKEIMWYKIKIVAGFSKNVREQAGSNSCNFTNSI